MSGRFADREAVHRLVLGPCGCPSQPHAEDWVDIRTELSGTEWATIMAGNTARSLAVLVRAWNLENEAGEVPVTEATLEALDLPTFTAIDRWIGEHIEVPKVPNPSAGPSRRGSRGPATRTRTTRPNGSSMTPSWQPAGASATSGTPLPSS